MASIKDAVEESITDNHALLKIAVYSVPLFVCIQSIISGVDPKTGLLLIGTVLTSILMLGYMLKCTMNVAGEAQVILPSFNILGVFFAGLKAAIVLTPIAIISKLLATLCIGLLLNSPLPENMILIFSWIIGIIFGSFVYTSYLLYSRKGKVLDAYNLVLISKYCIDILLGVIFMKILIALVDLILIAPIAYVLWLFVGLQNPIAIFFLCLIITFNLTVMGHYLAQIGYEIIETDVEEKEEDTKYAQLEKERLEKLKNNDF